MPTYEFKCPSGECDNFTTVTCTFEEYEELATPTCFHDWDGSEHGMVRDYSGVGFAIEGLPKDRFKIQDKLKENRAKADDRLDQHYADAPELR